MNRLLCLLLCACALAGGEVLAGWPALAMADERHSVALRLPTGAVEFGWEGQAPVAVEAPAGGGEALLALPLRAGRLAGTLRRYGGEDDVAVRLVDAAAAWPIAGLRDGLPVDAEGVAVVLLDRRRTANDLRRARLGPAAPPRPGGRPLLVGDPLASAFGSAWSGLAAEQRPAAGHAALVALADPGRPRGIVWCPDQAALYAGTWPEEGRLCSALVRRLAALGIAPRLTVALPPAPADPAWRAAAQHRAAALADAAGAAGWHVLDLAAAAGEPQAANRLADGLWAEAPVGEALARVRTALAAELAK